MLYVISQIFNFFSMCEIQPICIAIFQIFTMSHAQFLTIICNIALLVLFIIISYLTLHCPNNAPNHSYGISQNCSNLCSLPLGGERLYTPRVIPPSPTTSGGGGGGGGTWTPGRKGGNPWGERRLYLFLNFLSQFSDSRRLLTAGGGRGGDHQRSLISAGGGGDRIFNSK